MNCQRIFSPILHCALSVRTNRIVFVMKFTKTRTTHLGMFIFSYKLKYRKIVLRRLTGTNKNTRKSIKSLLLFNEI